MERLPGILFGTFFLVLGITLIFGAQRKWDWLVDPPSENWLFDSQSLLKKLFGKKFSVGFTYFLGVMFILVSLIGLYSGIRNW